MSTKDYTKTTCMLETQTKITRRVSLSGNGVLNDLRLYNDNKHVKEYKHLSM